MEQHNHHSSPSFINIAVLLLFAAVIAVASSVTTYFFLNSRSNEEYSASQSSVVPPTQTYVQPTSVPIQTTTQTTSDETAGWKVYRNEKYGFEFRYPLTWQLTNDNKYSVTISNPDKPKEEVVIMRQKDIPQVSLKEDLIERISVDSIPAQLYHDTDAKTGLGKIDRVIFDVPNSEDDIYIAGYGETFDLMLSSFKLIK